MFLDWKMGQWLLQGLGGVLRCSEVAMEVSREQSKEWAAVTVADGGTLNGGGMFESPNPEVAVRPEWRGLVLGKVSNVSRREWGHDVQERG